MRVSIVDHPLGHETIVFAVLQKISTSVVELVPPRRAQLIFRGPYPRRPQHVRVLQRLRQAGLPAPRGADLAAIESIHASGARPLFLYHSGENHSRYPHKTADYSITHDLGVFTPTHFRLGWWQYADWSAAGFDLPTARTRRRLDIKRLQQPLGSAFLERDRKAVIITSHLREPRRSIVEATRAVCEVDGYGPAFDRTINNHNNSGFFKEDVLKKYAFNLCAENSLWPGYYTEKIPEAFEAGCLPITWVDENFVVDFNNRALINLLPWSRSNFRELREVLLDEQRLEAFADQPLIRREPSLDPLIAFLLEVVKSAR